MNEREQPRLREVLRADHEQLQATRLRYDTRFDDELPGTTWKGIVADLLSNVGFQQLFVFRLASAASRRGLTPIAMMCSRLIRHVYGAEMHWEASIEPGIVIVHGNGLVISRSAHVSRRCILSQHVTLGISTGRVGEPSGAPRLLENVHVAPGAVLVGPITVGPDSKIAPNAVVLESIPAHSIAGPAPLVVAPRGGARAGSSDSASASNA
jgi:serine O-acetyltransferase